MVSYCIITYNNEAFVRDAIFSALKQRYSDIEYIISDDASTDSTWQVIQSTLKEAKSSDRVKALRGETNVGIGGNINRVVQAASGEMIVIAAGDDISHPYRTLACVNAFERFPQAHSVYTDHQVFEDSTEVDLNRYFSTAYPNPRLEMLAGSLSGFVDTVKPLVTGATHAWRRRVFEHFGPLGAGTMFEDMAISFRSISMGGICHIQEPLVLYRRHGGNACFNANDSLCENIEALRRVQEKEVRCLRGWLTGYKYMKRDLKKVAGLTMAERLVLGRKLNRGIALYRTQIEMRRSTWTKRFPVFFRYCMATQNKPNPEVLKLMVPSPIMDHLRLQKQKFATWRGGRSSPNKQAI